MLRGRGRVLAAALLAAVLAAVACRAPALGPVTTVKLGLVAPLSGAAAAEGARWVVAAQQAVHHWNATTEAPFKVELVVYDEGDGLAAARNLLADPRVLGVAGFARPPAAAEALAHLQNEGLPVVLAAGPNHAVTSHNLPGPLYWLAQSEYTLAQGFAALLAQQVGPGPVAIIVGPSTDDAEFAGSVAVSLPGREVRRYALPAAVAGYRDLVNAAADGNPRAVVLSVGPGEARSLIALLDARRRPLAIGLATHAASEESLRDLGSLEAYWASPFADPNAVGDAHWFVEGYRARTGARPTPGSAAAQDALVVLLGTLEVSAARVRVPDRAAVRAALAGGRDWPGALQRYRFDESGTLVTGAPTILFRMRRDLRFPGETVGSYQP